MPVWNILSCFFSGGQYTYYNFEWGEKKKMSTSELVYPYILYAYIEYSKVTAYDQ